MTELLERILPVLAIAGFFLTIYGRTRLVVTARNRARPALVLPGAAAGTLLGWSGDVAGQPAWVAWLAGSTHGLGLALYAEYRCALRDGHRAVSLLPPGLPA